MADQLAAARRTALRQISERETWLALTAALIVDKPCRQFLDL